MVHTDGGLEGVDAAFVAEFNQIQTRVHNTALAHGFWGTAPNVGEKIALMHSELSEALEVLRKSREGGHPVWGEVEEELADTVIRIMDFAKHYNLNIAKAIVMKDRRNQDRPEKHGKEF